MGLIESLVAGKIDIRKEFDMFESTFVYTIAYDKSHERLCWFYDLEGIGVQMIEKYYEDNELNKFDIHVHNRKYRERSRDVQDMIGKKLCVLDGKVVTYDVVIKQAETHEVKGYKKKGKLKKTLNIFETV